MWWTDKEKIWLTELWNVRKKTATECAEIMNITRNSVMGQVRRLGLDSRPDPIPQPRKRTPRRIGKKVTKLESFHEERVPNKQRPLAQPLHHIECQWITGPVTADETCKCRRPVHARSFCEEHFIRVYPHDEV